MTYTNKAQFSAKWDVRTGSPRRLWRALHDFLDDNGFEHEYEELKLEQSPIDGTATFSDSLLGQREYERRASLWFLRDVVGLVLCLTIILITVGLALMRSSVKLVRTTVRIDVEGEVYRTRGANINTARAEEVLDVIADTRITMQVWGGEPAEESKYDIRRPTQDHREIVRLEKKFKELSERLDGTLPRVSLTRVDSSGL